MRSLTTQLTQPTFEFPEAEWSGYDCYEAYRSDTGDGGPFLPLTGVEWAPAEMVIPLLATYPVEDKALDLLVCGQPVEVAFTSGVPDDVLLALQGALPGWLSAELQDDGIHLTTIRQGTEGTLYVPSGEVATLLGLTTPQAQGRMWYPNLEAGRVVYSFVDPLALVTSAYLIRYRKRSTGAVSAASQPLPANPVGGLAPSQLSEGYLVVRDVAGVPVVSRTVRVFPEYDGTGQAYVGAVSGMTDTSGRVTFMLPRGALVLVAVDGTTISRKVRVPDAASFDLLAPEVGEEDDQWKVCIPKIVVGERRSM